MNQLSDILPLIKTDTDFTLINLIKIKKQTKGVKIRGKEKEENQETSNSQQEKCPDT
jgi:hypothetical protein